MLRERRQVKGNLLKIKMLGQILNQWEVKLEGIKKKNIKKKLAIF